MGQSGQMVQCTAGRVEDCKVLEAANSKRISRHWKLAHLPCDFCCLPTKFLICRGQNENPRNRLYSSRTNKENKYGRDKTTNLHFYCQGIWGQHAVYCMRAGGERMEPLRQRFSQFCPPYRDDIEECPKNPCILKQKY